MILRTAFLKNFLIRLVCLGCCALTLAAQTNESPKESAAAAPENQAREISRQWSGQSFRRAIDLYRIAASEWQKLGNSENALNCFIEVSRLESVLGKYEASLQTLLKAQDLTEKQKTNSEKIKLKSLISTAYLRIGKVRESQKHLEESLNSLSLVTDNETQTTVFVSAGEFHYAKNDFEKAIGYYRKALESLSNSRNKTLESETLIKIAYVFMSMGEPVKGIETVEIAKRNFEEIGDKRGLATALIAIGHLSIVMDENRTALDSYFKAAEFFPDDTDVVEKARLYNGIGSVYEDYGEWQLSLDYRQKALQLFKDADYAFGQLATLHSLVKLNFLLNNTESAVNYFLETRKLSERLNDKFFLAITLLHVGDHYFKSFQNAEAVRHYEKSLAAFNRIRFYYWSAVSLTKLGNCHFQNGNTEKAARYFDSSLAITRKINAKFDESETLFNLGRLEKSRLNLEKSLTHLTQSLQITESISSNITNSKLKKTYNSTVYDRYELFINLSMKLNEASRDQNYFLQALQASEKSRARALLENLALSDADFTKDAAPEIVRRENEIRVLLNNKTDKLTDLLSQNAGKSEIAKLSGEINELENELETILATLKQQSPLYSAIKNPALFDVGEFQEKILDEDSLLLEFSLGDEESYLWIIEKNSVSAFVLPPRAEIESRVEKLRELLGSRIMKSGETLDDFQQRSARAETEFTTESKILSRQIFGQVSEKLTDKRLIIVADGKLHYFPLAALPLPASDSDDPILLTNETVYAPSAQSLLFLEKSRQQKSETAKNLLIFSDPIFTADDVRLSPEKAANEAKNRETASGEKFRFVESLNSLPRLTASKSENEAILKIVGNSGADSFTGFKANREQLINAATSEYKIIHFATHGVMDEQRPELSGIVLSGFDEKGQKQTQLFRIHDIYGLDLNADLVVLSACETGIGKEVKGEGLMSLNNAFLQVGAKSVMASLWKVEDGATLELMKSFYASVADENLTPPQALRRAQINLRSNPKYKSPFYWAAFTVQGDFRNVPQISGGRGGGGIYFFALAPLLLIGIYLYRRRKLREAARITTGNSP